MSLNMYDSGPVSLKNPVPINQVISSTSATTRVTSSASDGTILAANTNRKGATIYNESTQTLYLLLGTGTSSATNYTVQMPAGSYYEVPTRWAGVIKGIWASANGAAQVTELT